jgi:hypothetical protein
MSKLNGKIRRDTFVRLSHAMLASEAWQSLDSVAAAIYVEIAARYNGRNNGAIPYSYREAAKRFRIGQAAVGKAFASLQQAGLIATTQKGWFTAGRFRRATRWRLPQYPAAGYCTQAEAVAGVFRTQAEAVATAPPQKQYPHPRRSSSS